MKKNFLTAAASALLISSLTAQAGAADLRVNAALAQQPAAFVSQSAVKGRLRSLIGLSRAQFLQKNFGTVSTLQNAGGVVAVTGCRPHDCAGNGSLVVYDAGHDAFKVWLTVNKQTRVFTEKGFAAKLNSDVQTYADAVK